MEVRALPHIQAKEFDTVRNFRDSIVCSCQFFRGQKRNLSAWANRRLDLSGELPCRIHTIPAGEDSSAPP